MRRSPMRSLLTSCLLVTVPAACTALAVLYPAPAAGVLLAVLALLLFLKPDLAAILAVAVLPFPLGLPLGLAVEVSATDALIPVALAGWLFEGFMRHERRSRTSPLRGLRFALGAYGVAMLVSIAVHPTIPAVVTALQRIALVIGGLLLGAGLMRAGKLRVALELFLASASVLAVAAILTTGSGEFLGVQKNPAGGLISAALFVAILVKSSSRWIMYAPVLAIGLVATQSRGALLATLVAAAVALVIVRLRDQIRLLAGLAGVGALLFVGYIYLPALDRTRLLRFSGPEEYALKFRTEFQADALDRFQASPWTGVGVGNYVGGPRVPGILDPHQVLIFQLAEGGIPLLLGFLVLVIGGAIAVLRYSRTSPLALAALTIHVATVVHSLVDIYWVRGTPTAAWMLIGATLVATQLAAQGDPLALEWAPQRSGPRHRRARGEKGKTSRPAAMPHGGGSGA